ncbi:helix-turn-helix domain-containing protein [Actinomadura rugatobispora]|uniref:Helix-turn-helix domain-containing protein n=1 Tax=Actinomadura rugatobispora TaxID=1994 RepID=A0ABW1AJ68_9ACTN|nr:helix-turn-helix transcriptional regulator [Actinomadura rugatobispora]
MPQRPNDLRPWESPEALFGSELRHYREAAGLSLDKLADQIPFAKSTISAAERGESRCDRSLAVESDRALDSRDALTRLWDGLFKKSGAVPTWFTNWFKHEPKTTHIRSFQPLIIDGLLQTPEYASALLGGDEGAAETRITRQDILTRTDPAPPSLLCVIDESVLYREIGSPAIMSAQLEHLLAISSKRVKVQIVPSVNHEGLSGAFVIGNLKDGGEIAYREGALRGDTTADRDDIRSLNDQFASIQALAYPLNQSAQLIRKVATERWI